MSQIQWFPGHMAKAKRLVEAKLPLVDIVYELRDARIPISSANPMLDDIIKNKPRLVLLNKADLADKAVTDKFLAFYEAEGIPALAINSLTGNPLKTILAKTNEILTALREKESKKGMKPRAFRGMVLGIPNVGKSQFINCLAGKNKAKTGNVPGITKTQVYLRAGKDLELLDNPGILWPKFEDKKVGLNLALVGSIKDDIYVPDEVVLYGLRFLTTHYPMRLISRYNLDNVSLEDPLTILDAIGINRGCLLPGGTIDYDRVQKLFLYDFRNQMFGSISLERVEEHV